MFCWCSRNMILPWFNVFTIISCRVFYNQEQSLIFEGIWINFKIKSLLMLWYIYEEDNLYYQDKDFTRDLQLKLLPYRIRANRAPLLIKTPSWIECHMFAKIRRFLHQKQAKFECNTTLKALKFYRMPAFYWRGYGNS